MMRLPQQVELDHALECLPEEGGGLFLPKTHPWVVSNETIISSVSETADLSQEGGWQKRQPKFMYYSLYTDGFKTIALNLWILLRGKK